MKIKSILSIIALTVLLTGCNKQVVDFNYTFNYAIIQLPNGEIVQGYVESWTDYEDGEQLQVKIDGVTYLCSSYNCVLMHK
ncbi:MAG: hypothetical protein IKP50_00255 [Bacilli bacterium]|nr:hypothetical protein [Bacilli bacterium]